MTNVIILVFVVFSFITLWSWMESRSKASRKKIDADLAAKLDRIEELEQRVRTLERIVTDNSYKLDTEFDRMTGT